MRRVRAKHKNIERQVVTDPPQTAELKNDYQNKHTVNDVRKGVSVRNALRVLA